MLDRACPRCGLAPDAVRPGAGACLECLERKMLADERRALDELTCAFVDEAADAVQEKLKESPIGTAILDWIEGRTARRAREGKP